MLGTLTLKVKNSIVDSEIATRMTNKNVKSLNVKSPKMKMTK